MHARPVVGAFFIKMLYDSATWRKWAGRDRTKASGWAPFPDANYVPPPRPTSVTPVVPTAQQEAATWRYTTGRPAARWFAGDFDDSSWLQGPGGFGTKGTPGSTVRTEWRTADIWLRRDVVLPDGINPSQICLLVHHDEDVEVYINGVLAAREEGYVTRYDPIVISAEAAKTLKPGRNLVAVHCRQTSGGQYIDVGLATAMFK
jgi:hypothetical protein